MRVPVKQVFVESTSKLRMSRGRFKSSMRALRASSFFIDVVVPDGSYLSKDASTLQQTDAYESTYGDRTIRICGNAALVGPGSLTSTHSIAPGADTGDSDVRWRRTLARTTSGVTDRSSSEKPLR